MVWFFIMRGRQPRGLKSKKLLRRWQSRKKRLLGSLPVLLECCRANGNSEAVHELRVAVRRLRLYVRLGRPLLGRKSAKQFLSWARSISKATSPVRDLDVALEWLQGHDHTEEASERILAQRTSAMQALSHNLQAPPRGLLKGLTRLKRRGRLHAHLAHRYLKIESRIAGSVMRCAPRFFDMSSEEQHQLRRMIRWWRYLLEVGLPRQAQKQDRLLSFLLELQEATGERQNLMLCEAALRRFRCSVFSKELQRTIAAEQVATSGRIRKAFSALQLLLRPKA